MRGLLQLFAVYGGFLAFMLLETISLVLIVQYNHRQKEIAINSWGLLIASTEQRISNLTQYIGLKEEVDKLRQQNIELMQQLDNARYAKIIAGDSLVIDSSEQVFTYIAADVISNAAARESNNSLRLNRGEKQGVRPNMGVIASDGNGLVGIVREVTPRYCRVMSLLHRQTRIKAAIRGKNYFGTLTWPGKDPRLMQLEAVPRHAKISVGDIVQTSGYSQIFPHGIPIGKVIQANRESGDYFYDITVELYNDLSNVQYVYVVKNEMREEHQTLDQATNE